MTTPRAAAVRASASFADRVAAIFASRPGEWIDGRELAQAGGAYAWRSRVSDVRRERGWAIENRQRRVKDPRTGAVFVVSEYRYRPALQEARA